MINKKLHDIVEDVSNVSKSVKKAGDVCYKLQRFILEQTAFEYKEFILGSIMEIMKSLNEISNEIFFKITSDLKDCDNAYYFPSLDIIGTVKIGARIAIVQRCNQLDEFLEVLPDESKDLLKGLIFDLSLNLYEEAFRSGMEYKKIFTED